MRKLIFAFVGPSGCGKTTVMEALLKKHRSRLGFVKTVTTRPPRGPEEHALYTFVSTEDFMALLAQGRLLQNGDVHYAGNWYDNDRADVDAVFDSGKIGICALVENSVLTFRAAGYEVVMIRLRPHGGHDGRSEERRKIDEERERNGPEADAVIVNDFSRADGLARTIEQAEKTMRRHAKGALGKATKGGRKKAKKGK